MQQVQMQMTERSMGSVLGALRKNVAGIQEARRKVEEAVLRQQQQQGRGVHHAALGAAMAAAPPLLGGLLTAAASAPRGPDGHIITPPTSLSSARGAGGAAGFSPLGQKDDDNDNEEEQGEEEDVACPLPPMLPLAAAPLTGVRRPREEEGGEGGAAYLRKRAKPSGRRIFHACEECNRKKTKCSLTQDPGQHPCDACVGVPGWAGWVCWCGGGGVGRGQRERLLARSSTCLSDLVAQQHHKQLHPQRAGVRAAARRPAAIRDPRRRQRRGRQRARGGESGGGRGAQANDGAQGQGQGQGGVAVLLGAPAGGRLPRGVQAVPGEGAPLGAHQAQPVGADGEEPHQPRELLGLGRAWWGGCLLAWLVGWSVDCLYNNPGAPLAHIDQTALPPPPPPSSHPRPAASS